MYSGYEGTAGNFKSGHGLIIMGMSKKKDIAQQHRKVLGKRDGNSFRANRSDNDDEDDGTVLTGKKIIMEKTTISAKRATTTTPKAPTVKLTLTSN